MCPVAVGGLELERSLDRRHTLPVHLPVCACLAAAVGQRRTRGELGVRERVGDPRGLQQRLAERGLAALALGLAEADERLAALAALHVGCQLDGV
jgi:hypothetical protein